MPAATAITAGTAQPTATKTAPSAQARMYAQMTMGYGASGVGWIAGALPGPLLRIFEAATQSGSRS